MTLFYKNIRRLVFYLIPFFVSCMCCPAALNWKDHELNFDVPAGGTAVEFTYSFTNDGPLAVELSAPSTSCGCTLAKWEKAVYGSGESGTLRGSYNTVGRRGHNVVTITIKGAEVDGDIRRPFTEALKLNVTVPEIVKISPGILLWRKNSAATSKTVRFTVNDRIPLSLAMAKSNEQGMFVYEWVEIEKNRVYDLIATPNSLSETQQTVVTVEGTSTEGNMLRFQAHLIIR